MTRVMINGDDLGMNQSCSSAIIQALKNGLITDTTAMANGAFLDEAIAMARVEGFVDRIGVHFNLTEGVPLTREIKNVPLFVKDSVFHREFCHSPRALSVAEQQAVYRELCAQVLRLREHGVAISHADSHHYVHTYTALASIVAQVCKEYRIPRVRLNRTFDTFEHPKITEHRVDNAYWREQGFVTSAHFGRLDDLSCVEIPDNTEILVHPDFDKDGRLIDRSGMIDGVPVGKVLDAQLYRKHGLILSGCNETL